MRNGWTRYTGQWCLTFVTIKHKTCLSMTIYETIIFKNGPCKICEWKPLKKLKWYDLFGLVQNSFIIKNSRTISAFIVTFEKGALQDIFTMDCKNKSMSFCVFLFLSVLNKFTMRKKFLVLDLNFVTGWVNRRFLSTQFVRNLVVGPPRIKKLFHY